MSILQAGPDSEGKLDHTEDKETGTAVVSARCREAPHSWQNVRSATRTLEASAQHAAGQHFPPRASQGLASMTSASSIECRVRRRWPRSLALHAHTATSQTLSRSEPIALEYTLAHGSCGVLGARGKLELARELWTAPASNPEYCGKPFATRYTGIKA